MTHVSEDRAWPGNHVLMEHNLGDDVVEIWNPSSAVASCLGEKHLDEKD